MKKILEQLDKLIEVTNMDKQMLKRGKKYKVILPTGKGHALYTATLNAALGFQKEHGKGTKVEDLSKTLK